VVLSPFVAFVALSPPLDIRGGAIDNHNIPRGISKNDYFM
jgi:hypothetical protein